MYVKPLMGETKDKQRAVERVINTGQYPSSEKGSIKGRRAECTRPAPLTPRRTIDDGDRYCPPR